MSYKKMLMAVDGSAFAAHAVDHRSVVLAYFSDRQKEVSTVGKRIAQF